MPSDRPVADDLADVYAQRSSSSSGLSRPLPDCADNRVEAVGDRSPNRSNLRTEVLVTVLLVLGAVFAIWAAVPRHSVPKGSVGGVAAGGPNPQAINVAGAPTHAHSRSPVSKTAASAPHSSTGSKTGGTTITYAVTPGDTLGAIGRWFVEHGYGRQYAANQQVITANQSLIVPGELISITNGVMTIKPPVDHSPHRHRGDHRTNDAAND